ncbi:MAG: 2'-deoxycytidine 5'-triphosphate deaminase [Nitrospinota bacterium]
MRAEATTRPKLPVGDNSGILPRQQLRLAIKSKIITADQAIDEAQLQPSSIDLRLGDKAYRVRSSFLPHKKKVEKMLHELLMYDINLTDGAILEKGNVYIIPLMESLELPRDIRGRANPKSSTGRLDIFTRVITDNSQRFEDIDAGYNGRLYLEVVPRSFTIKVQSGLCLNQLRLIRGNSSINDHRLLAMHDEVPLIYGSGLFKASTSISDGIYVGIEVHTENSDRIIGYKAKKNSRVIDLTSSEKYEVHDFWEPIKSPHENFLILEPEEFYIFASKERVRVPMDCAAEMVEFDAGSGELRTHYAGFFDSGFGDVEAEGTKAVLEVRPHDVPFRVEDDQPFFKLRYEKMAARPKTGYGSGIGSNYYNQGLKLSKHFVMRENGRLSG